MSLYVVPGFLFFGRAAAGLAEPVFSGEGLQSSLARGLVGQVTGRVQRGRPVVRGHRFDLPDRGLFRWRTIS